MVARRSLFPIATAGLAAALTGGAQARDEGRALAATLTDAIESCVDTSTIRFEHNDRHVLLDSADAGAVSAALARRYPLVERDGLAPQSIVLWRKPGAGWLYVSLLVNPAKPGESCFTATFVAGRFDLTAALVEKYFGIGTASE